MCHVSCCTMYDYEWNFPIKTPSYKADTSSVRSNLGNIEQSVIMEHYISVPFIWPSMYVVM